MSDAARTVSDAARTMSDAALLIVSALVGGKKMLRPVSLQGGSSSSSRVSMAAGRQHLAWRLARWL